MPLGEYCLQSSNVSHHCPDVRMYSIQIDSEYHENTNIPASLSINRKGRAVLSHRPQSIFLTAKLK